MNHFHRPNAFQILVPCASERELTDPPGSPSRSQIHRGIRAGASTTPEKIGDRSQELSLGAAGGEMAIMQRNEDDGDEDVDTPGQRGDIRTEYETNCK